MFGHRAISRQVSFFYSNHRASAFLNLLQQRTINLLFFLGDLHLGPHHRDLARASTSHLWRRRRAGRRRAASGGGPGTGRPAICAPATGSTARAGNGHRAGPGRGRRAGRAIARAPAATAAASPAAAAQSPLSQSPLNRFRAHQVQLWLVYRITGKSLINSRSPQVAPSPATRHLPAAYSRYSHSTFTRATQVTGKSSVNLSAALTATNIIAPRTAGISHRRLFQFQLFPYNHSAGAFRATPPLNIHLMQRV